MVAKSPVLLHRWQAWSAILVRRDYLGSSVSRVEVQIDTATGCPPCNVFGVHEDFLRMRIAVVQAVRVSNIVTLRIEIRAVYIIHLLVAPLLEVACVDIDWMRAVDIAIDRITSV
jgi:hypothetical protein